VYGVTGSGKSTLAARISAATGIPWTHVDDLTWEPGWVAVPEREQRRLFTQICAGEAWILDTAYSDWLDVPLARGPRGGAGLPAVALPGPAAPPHGCPDHRPQADLQRQRGDAARHAVT
jgi:hypothetical protein